jgi:hypothetical protein
MLVAVSNGMCGDASLITKACDCPEIRKSLRINNLGEKTTTKITPGIDDCRLLIFDCRSEESGSIQRQLRKSAIINRQSSIKKCIHE